MVHAEQVARDELIDDFAHARLPVVFGLPGDLVWALDRLDVLFLAVRATAGEKEYLAEPRVDLLV